MPSLLVITDRTVSPDLMAGVSAALEGGVTHILLREKTMAAGPLAVLAQKLRTVTAAMGAHLLIHDRVDIALAMEADGVHLPESGMATVDARRLLDTCQPRKTWAPIGGEGAQPVGKLLGRSCHSVKTACEAFQEGADYVTLSPLFATRSHPQAPALGVRRFSVMRAAIPGPVLALGGIHGGNVTDALSTGAQGVALIRGILEAAEPCQAARTLLSRINLQPSEG